MVWQPLPTKTKEGKGIIYYQAGKKPDVYGVFLVDPKTGGLGQSLFLSEIRERHPKAELRHVEVSKWLAAEKYRAEEKEYERELAGKRGEIARKVPTDVKYYLTKEGTKLYWKGEPPAHIKGRIVSEISEAEYKYAKVETPPEIREKEYLVRPVPKPGEQVSPWMPRKELKGLVTIGEVPTRPIEPMLAPPPKKEVVWPMAEIRAAPKIPWYEKPSELARRLTYKAEIKKEKRVPYIAGAVALGAVKYPIELGKMVVHPIKTVKGLGYAMTHPIETGYGIGERLKFEAPIVVGEVGAMVGLGYVAPKVVRKVAKKVVTPKVKIAEPSELVWYRKFPSGKELVEARGKIAVEIGKKPYKIDIKGMIAAEPYPKGLQKVLGKYQFQIWKPKAKKPIPAEATLKGYTKQMKALYRAEIKVKGLPPVKTITAIKAKKIAEVRGLKEYAFAKEVFVPKRLERVGVGVLREKMIVKYPKYEKVYAQYYAEEIGGKIIKAFEKPPITVKKMLVSKKAQLMLKPLEVPKPKVIVKPPLIPPIKELAKRVAVEVHIARIKIPTLIPIPKVARIPKRISIKKIEPITKVIPITKITPITKVTPITKITPITKVTPITKITPITKVTPILRVTPITKLAPLLKITPITKVTPIEVPVPPLIPPIIPVPPYIHIPKVRPIRKKKKKRILKRPTKYRPSLVGIRMEKHIMKEPKYLTGIEVRKILI